MLLIARHYSPGALPRLESLGAERVRVCALSGLRATAECPAVDEWFLPGTAPVARCDWHRGGEVAWPAGYVDWASQNGRVERIASFVPHLQKMERREGGAAFQIVSPRSGDRYQIPTGVDHRYATIALRAAGAPPGTLRWFLDGRPISGTRWTLIPGQHVVRAVTASGASVEARFDVLVGIDNVAVRP